MASERTRQLYDEVFYVLSGHGSTSIRSGNGETHSFEWGPRALFSPPLNAPYRLFNVSGNEPVRLVSANDLPFLFNVFRNENFLFDNSFAFPERVGRNGYFAGEGDFLPIRPGKHMWETNFVPDLGSLSLPEWEARGAGSRNVKIILSDSSMHAHSSEMPVGAYKKGHRHGPGVDLQGSHPGPGPRWARPQHPVPCAVSRAARHPPAQPARAGAGPGLAA